MINYVQMSKCRSLNARQKYIFNDEKQEEILIKKNADYDFSEYIKYEKKINERMNFKNSKVNQGREFIIAIPNEWSEISREELEKRCDEIREIAIKKNTDFCYAVHWNSSRTNLHLHIIFSERTKTKQEFEVYKKSVWLKKDGTLAKSKEERYELKHLKGSFKLDKNGNKIPKKNSEETQFTNKNTIYKEYKYTEKVKEEILDLYKNKYKLNIKENIFKQKTRNKFRGVEEKEIKINKYNNLVEDTNKAVEKLEKILKKYQEELEIKEETYKEKLNKNLSKKDRTNEKKIIEIYKDVNKKLNIEEPLERKKFKEEILKIKKLEIDYKEKKEKYHNYLKEKDKSIIKGILGTFKDYKKSVEKSYLKYKDELKKFINKYNLKDTRDLNLLYSQYSIRIRNHYNKLNSSINETPIIKTEQIKIKEEPKAKEYYKMEFYKYDDLFIKISQFNSYNLYENINEPDLIKLELKEGEEEIHFRDLDYKFYDLLTEFNIAKINWEYSYSESSGNFELRIEKKDLNKILNVFNKYSSNLSKDIKKIKEEQKISNIELKKRAEEKRKERINNPIKKKNNYIDYER